MLEFKDIKLSFPDETILDGFSFFINNGDKAVFRGPSGKGKSTILNLILGFLRPDSGEILFEDRLVTERNIRKLRAECAWLPQDFQLGEGAVWDVILRPFEFKKNQALRPGDEQVKAVIQELGLNEGVLEKRFTSISEGQKQRVGLAICHLLNRRLILLDEPTSALDPQSKEKVVKLFLKNPGTTVISTSHDPDWIEHCDKIIPLK